MDNCDDDSYYEENYEPSPPESPPEHHDCPRCHNDLRVVWGKFGQFVGCTRYPRCTFSCSIEEVHPSVLKARTAAAGRSK